ncbi:MAG: hypothetical protein WKF57_00055 [Nakamurella sp.]
MPMTPSWVAAQRIGEIDWVKLKLLTPFSNSCPTAAAPRPSPNRTQIAGNAAPSWLIVPDHEERTSSHRSQKPTIAAVIPVSWQREMSATPDAAS